MSKPILGFNAKLFRGEAGSTGTIEVKNVRDVNWGVEKGVADATTRGSNGWKVSVTALKDASLEFVIYCNPDDEDYKVFTTAFFTDEAIAIFVTDGQGNGLDADWDITNLKTSQQLEDVVKVDVSAKPSATGRNPEWKGE